MEEDKSFSSSLEHSNDNNPRIVAFHSSKKRKPGAEELDLLPLPKHFYLEQQASLPDSSYLSSNLESGECSYVMEETNTSNEASSSKEAIYSTGSSCSGFATSNSDQYYSTAHHKTQEDVEDFTYMEFICPEPEFADEELSEILNPVGSYMNSSARWSVSNQYSEEATMKPTIDQEFENYFSTLMM